MVLSAGRPGSGSGRAAAVRALRAPFPAAGENAFLDLVRLNDPAIHAAVRAWHHAAPAAAVLFQEEIHQEGIQPRRIGHDPLVPVALSRTRSPQLQPVMIHNGTGSLSRPQLLSDKRTTL